jgi:hypothetical protein
LEVDTSEICDFIVDSEEREEGEDSDNRKEELTSCDTSVVSLEIRRLEKEENMNDDRKEPMFRDRKFKIAEAHIFIQ